MKIDFENQILALFDGYFWPFKKSHEKIKSYQNYEQRPQILQNSDFQNHFPALKINGIFLNLFSVKNIRLGKKLLQMKSFENFDFFKSTLF